MAGQREWPRGQENGAGRNAPTGRFLIPDGILTSGDSLAGPLRTGTSADVGPRARGPVAPGYSRDSCFGMDRVSPRDFDPMGTTRNRFADIPSSLVPKKRR